MAEPSNKSFTNRGTIIFMVVLSFVCALILSALASALKTPKEIAKELDRSKQMLIAARIVNPRGFFQVKTVEGDFVPARYHQGGTLTEEKTSSTAAEEEILEVYRLRIHPFLVDEQGVLLTFAESKLDEEKYTNDFRKMGYYRQPLKLIYTISPNPGEGKKDAIEGYVIPVNGFGLWDAMYGYLAIEPDGNTVIGISWYDQKETPGLGAIIAEPGWQHLFPGKKLFQPNADGTTDVMKAQLGITVVKGKVSEVYGSSPKAQSAVDGMAGATLTGNGVTNAYKDVLAAYRPFLEKRFLASKAASKTKEGK